MNLVDPKGSIVLEEEDAITIHAPESPDAYLIDFELLLRAKGDDVKAPENTDLPETPGQTFTAPQEPDDQHPL